MTIANVACLNHAGEASAPRRTYLGAECTFVAQAIATATRLAFDNIGRKKLFMVWSSVSIASSALCAPPSGLEEMVFFRILQGASARRSPPSQSVISTSTRASGRARRWRFGAPAFHDRADSSARPSPYLTIIQLALGLLHQDAGRHAWPCRRLHVIADTNPPAPQVRLLRFRLPVGRRQAHSSDASTARRTRLVPIVEVVLEFGIRSAALDVMIHTATHKEPSSTSSFHGSELLRVAAHDLRRRHRLLATMALLRRCCRT